MLFFFMHTAKLCTSCGPAWPLVRIVLATSNLMAIDCSVRWERGKTGGARPGLGRRYELKHLVRSHMGSSDPSYGCVYQQEDEDGKTGALPLLGCASHCLNRN